MGSHELTNPLGNKAHPDIILEGQADSTMARRFAEVDHDAGIQDTKSRIASASTSGARSRLRERLAREITAIMTSDPSLSAEVLFTPDISTSPKKNFTRQPQKPRSQLTRPPSV